MLEVLHRRPAPGGASAEGRITADAVLASADALPIDRILAAISPVEEELLRLLLLAPDQQPRVADELGPDQLPIDAGPRAVPGDRPPARARRPRGPTAVLDVGAAWPRLDDETRAPAQAILAQPSPDLALVASERIMYAVDRCLLAARATTARRARRLGRRRAARRGGARRSGDRRPARRPPTPEQRSPSIRRPADRASHSVGPRMTRRHPCRDPLDKQLVEAVLTRPRRARADVEEAKLATRGLSGGEGRTAEGRRRR